MNSKVAVIVIFVKDIDSVERLNSTLSEYGESIIGRMGVPHHKQKVNIISITIDASQETIEALSEKIKELHGVNTKTIYYE